MLLYCCLHHSAELADEVLVVELVSSEVGAEFLALHLRQLVAQVDHAPSEVVAVDLAASGSVDGLEARSDLVSGLALLHEVGQVLEQLSNVELLQLVNGLVEGCVWSRFKHPDVLLVLVTSWHIGGDVALLLQLQVLGLVLAREAVAHHLELAAEVVLLNDGVGANVVRGLAVADKNWLSGLDWLALALEAVVGVEAVNHPLGGVGIASVHAQLSKSGLGREDHVALWGAAQHQHLLVQVLVGNNLDFLTETDDIVASENVCGLHFHDLVDVARNWSLVHLGGVQAVRLVNVVLSDT